MTNLKSRLDSGADFGFSWLSSQASSWYALAFLAVFIAMKVRFALWLTVHGKISLRFSECIDFCRTIICIFCAVARLISYMLFGSEDCMFLSLIFTAKSALLARPDNHDMDSPLTLLPPWLNVVVAILVLGKLHFVLPRACRLTRVLMWNTTVGKLPLSIEV